jgi:outer membrane receptor protein involved in Fe transport
MLFANAETNLNANNKSYISGTIIDGTDGRPVEYATIALYRTGNKELITGGISDSEGFFKIKNIPNGKYYMTVTFMGYNTLTIPDIKINKEQRTVELNNIKIALNSKEIADVDVIADKSAVQYKIDKKVINVSQQLTAKSGSAVDILENIPSVKVDIEGNVSLRGSGSFTVLIDGRPTVLDPSDALSQIPAGAIDNIEIITNPSAKYEPDGAAGIINIITKKNKLRGVSGIVNANVGRFKNYGSDFTIDSRLEKVHFYIGGDYNHRNRPGDIIYNRDVFNKDNNDYHVQSNGDFNFNMWKYSLRGGLDWHLSKKDIFGINFRAGSNSRDKLVHKDYEEFYDLDTLKQLYITEDNSNRSGNFYETNIDYRHNFNKDKTHFIETQVIANHKESGEEAENIRRYTDDRINTAKKSTEEGPYSNIRLKLDYTKPFDWGGKLESGLQSQFSISEDNNKVYDYDTTSSKYYFQDKYSNNTKYTRNTQAVYSTFGGEINKFGYQAGLRMEYTYRFLELLDTTESYTIDRFDFFPTIHFSYKLPKKQQAMVSYTRRIERPRGYQLEPFISYRDAYNVYRGNPGLLPEYINSFDLSYQKEFKKKRFFSVEGYYRVTQNKIERIMSPFKEDSTLFMHTYVNSGTDYALGVELMVSYSYKKWYTTNLMADLYDYRLKGSVNGEKFEQHNFSWNTRFNNTFKINSNSRFQLDFSYQSPTVRAQGRSEGFFSASMAYKQDFFKRKMSATLQVRDIFGTWKHEFTSEGYNFHQYTYHKVNTPIVMLTISYKINNYKNKRGGKGGGGGISGGDDVM